MAWFGPLFSHDHTLIDVAQVHYVELGGAGLGVVDNDDQFHNCVPVCHNVIYRSHVSIDTSGGLRGYDKGQDTMVTSGKYDMWSVVAHELGHTISLGDLSAPDIECPYNSARATMCGPIIPSNTWNRIPDGEDKASANRGY